MGISRDSWHKRRNTGGKRTQLRKKRKFELGRPAAMTKLVVGGSGDHKRIRDVRARGGAIKRRALRLESGNFSWGSEVRTYKTRVLDVVYNASNNELVRTKTLVKNAIVLVDATPFRQYYERTYGVELKKKKAAAKAAKAATTDSPAVTKKEAVSDVKASGHVKAKQAFRRTTQPVESAIEDQLLAGRILACISSRPGQSGRCDGYILEGKELEFYQKKSQKRKTGAEKK